MAEANSYTNTRAALIRKVVMSGQTGPMARQTRLDLPGIPQHIVQRGNNRLPCFLGDNDRRHYLRWLRTASIEFDCAVHAYVLMDNHVHLLVTPPTVGAVSRMMQKLGRHYVGWFNHRHQRTGTLWEGRFKSCLVDSENYVLRCYRYIDLNPVRACIIGDPVLFPWSSCAAHCGQGDDSILRKHEAYVALGKSSAEQQEAYRDILNETLPAADLDDIRAFLQQQRALGGAPFRAMVEAQTRRFADVRPAHRPRKVTISQ